MERLMQYVWQHRLLPPGRLTTVDGRRVNVINPGQLNTASGPDFFNASIEIDGQKWAGNVEIHVRASDWHRHHHDNDPAYDSVILHVVDVDDTMIRRSDGQVIPQMIMPCSAGLNSEYHALTDTATFDLPCRHALAQMPEIYFTDWLTALGFERIYAKMDRIMSMLEMSHGYWEEACYVTIARTLGFGLNNDPMERMARSMPLNFLKKHCDTVTTIEAMLMGQAGLLERTYTDPYLQYLSREYRYYATKFGLRPLDSPGWKTSGTRPQNFPYRRIAYLAQLICDSDKSMMSRILEVKSVEEARRIFDVEMTGYWSVHYVPDGATVDCPAPMSRRSADILIINCVAPLLFAYGTAHGDDRLTQTAIDLLSEVDGEVNRLTNIFITAGVKVKDAFTSQALIQLRREYCEKQKCLYCRIGHRHLSSVSLRN